MRGVYYGWKEERALEKLSVDSFFMLLGITLVLGLISIAYDVWSKSVKTPDHEADDYGNGKEEQEEQEGRGPQPKPATAPIAATSENERNAIATTRNERNEELLRNERNERLREQAELIARLVKSETLYIQDGKGGYKRAGQVAIIRLATGLEPNGRGDSEYGQLRTALKPLLEPVFQIAAGRPEERAISK
jgi:hypothetical protein